MAQAQLPKTMRALRATKFSADNQPTLAVEEVPVPEPGPGEVLLRIRASAIQPADMLNSKGGFPTTTFPRTLGKDFAATVVRGPEHLVGHHVFGTSGGTFSFTQDGAHAEFAVVPTKGVVPIPENLSFAQAGGLGTPWATAAVALQRAEAKKGETVLVLGATGAVGSAVMQIAKSIGCQTLGVSRHGADISSVSDPTLQAAKELTGGRGPDVVVDTVGDFALTRAAFDVLANWGRMAVITAPRQGSTEMGVDFKSLYRRQVKIVGVNTATQAQEEMGEVLKDLVDRLEKGVLTAPAEDRMRKVGIEDGLKAFREGVRGAVIVFDEK